MRKKFIQVTIKENGDLMLINLDKIVYIEDTILRGIRIKLDNDEYIYVEEDLMMLKKQFFYVNNNKREIIS